MTYVTDRIVKVYQDVLTQVRKDLGRSILIYYQTPGSIPSTSDSDGFDPVNLEPINPTASVTYPDQIKTITNVLVKWGPDTNPWQRLAGGALEPGEARLSMKLTDVLIDSSDLESSTYFQNCRKVIVDGQDCRVKTVIVKSGLRDLFNCKVIVERVNS